MLPGRARGRRAGAGGRRTDPDRGQGHAPHRHSSDDQQTKYRSESDLAEGRARDPLPIFREQLREAGVLTDEQEEAMAAEIAALVEDATDFAESEPDADPATALEHVYADDAAGEPAPPWHPAPGQPAPGHRAPGAPSAESWS